MSNILLQKYEPLHSDNGGCGGCTLFEFILLKSPEKLVRNLFD